MAFIDVGYFNYINAEKIIDVGVFGSLPTKRLIDLAKEEGRFIDLTQGRKTRAIIYSECGGNLVLTAVAIHPPTVMRRVDKAIKAQKEKFFYKEEEES